MGKLESGLVSPLTPPSSPHTHISAHTRARMTVRLLVREPKGESTATLCRVELTTGMNRAPIDPFELELVWSLGTTERGLGVADQSRRG